MRYAIRNEAGGKVLEIAIMDVIADAWLGGVSARSVFSQLRYSQAETISVRINSRGGDVTEGFAIYQLLQQHKAAVNVEILGFAGSIASVIAMAGDNISIGEGGFIMIHNPSGVLRGEADEFRQFADLLDNMQSVIADVYVARTGQKKDDVIKWMNAETFMNARQALERGFVDAIIPAKTKAKGKAGSARNAAFAIFNEADLDGAPEELLAAVRAAHAAPEPDEEPPPQPQAIQQEEDQPAPARGGDLEKSEMKNLLKALGLAEDADEATAIAKVRKLEASADVGREVEQLLGVAGRECIGAVRALKVSQEASTELAREVAKLKIVNARRDFENARDQGLKEKRLTPAVAKHYTDKFEAACRDSDDSDEQARKAEAVAEDLKGFLKVAPRVVAAPTQQPSSNSGGDPVPTHNGKAFEAMAPIERHELLKSNPDLYNTLREDALARGAI